MEVIFTELLGVALVDQENKEKEYHANRSNGDSVMDKTKQYLGQLSPDMRDRLYEVYKHDFLMFGYTPY